jgi:hypothetical protein
VKLERKMLARFGNSSKTGSQNTDIKYIWGKTPSPKQQALLG